MKYKRLLGIFCIFALMNFVSAVNCIDSDGGKNYFEKGTVTDDLCLEDGSCFPTTSTDKCIASNKVYETYCLEDGSNWEGIEKICDSGCVDGACKEGSTQDVPTEGTCSDSDGGINYNQKGTLTITEKSSPSDHCADTLLGSYRKRGMYLIEYSCAKNSFPIFGTNIEDIYSLESYECPNGCREGACLEQAPECSPYKEFALFDRENSYNLDEKNYIVSIKESKQKMNTFDITINGETYSSKPYENSFYTNTGEKIFLGEPSAASPVMYTSIEFCMLPKSTTDAEEEQMDPSESDIEDAEQNGQENTRQKEVSQTECEIIGLRQDGEYCSPDKTLELQKEADTSCENNFECQGNVCVDNQCVSGNLIWRIINWFKKLFG
ncbi:MAG: hypothetical protein KJ592_04630 [Nanoarchaeota archaeon]|nr:hypothetical protein [Nanoarchaeota archaeon]